MGRCLVGLGGIEPCNAGGAVGWWAIQLGGVRCVGLEWLRCGEMARCGVMGRDVVERGGVGSGTVGVGGSG